MSQMNINVSISLRVFYVCARALISLKVTDFNNLLFHRNIRGRRVIPTNKSLRNSQVQVNQRWSQNLLHRLDAVLMCKTVQFTSYKTSNIYCSYLSIPMCRCNKTLLFKTKLVLNSVQFLKFLHVLI